MTNDSRLGVNPLSWVDPGTSTDKVKAGGSVPAAARQSTDTTAERHNVAHIFGPTDSATKEEAMGDSKIKIKQTMETTQVAQHLKDLATSLEAGTLRAEGGEKAVVLAIPESVNIEMKVSRKKGKAKLSLELEWKDDGKKVDGLKISDE